MLAETSDALGEELRCYVGTHPFQPEYWQAIADMPRPLGPKLLSVKRL